MRWSWNSASEFLATAELIDVFEFDAVLLPIGSDRFVAANLEKFSQLRTFAQLSFLRHPTFA